VGISPAMDALTLLKNDHRTVERLFKEFEKLGDRAYKGKRDVVDKIVTELSVHAAVEEQVFYPAIRKADPDIERQVLEALEEHHVVKWTLSELDGMDPQDERFDPKVSVLIESVRHHVKEEEGDLFPKVRKAMKPKERQELGEALEVAKRMAPEKPHPRAPDEPPGNLVAGPATAAVDKAEKTGKRAVRRVLSRVRR
jgi:hemerythrin superfamily protein